MLQHRHSVRGQRCAFRRLQLALYHRKMSGRAVPCRAVPVVSCLQDRLHEALWIGGFSATELSRFDDETVGSEKEGLLFSICVPLFYLTMFNVMPT